MWGIRRSWDGVPVLRVSHLGWYLCGYGDGGSLWWSYIEEMQLICCASNAVCEQKDISLQPGDWSWGILEAGAWTAHGEDLVVS